jgi:hypothetical protein
MLEWLQARCAICSLNSMSNPEAIRRYLSYIDPSRVTYEATPDLVVFGGPPTMYTWSSFESYVHCDAPNTELGCTRNRALKPTLKE